MPGQDLAFAGSPTGFTARGPATGRDRLRVGAGISIQMTQDLSILANYVGVFTGEQKNHTASVGFNFKF
jgi:outer membrane autotransporter protein